MVVKQILTKHYEGLSTDDKPTSVISGTTFRETDTRVLWITYDGTNWVVADRRVRLVNEDGTFIDVPGEFDTLEAVLSDMLDNVAVLQHHIHSRMRVYPQNVGSVITLAADAVANTFGSWTEIVPIDTIDFMYEVVGVVVEGADAATTYFIQLGFSIVDGTEPTTAQRMGERRIKLPTPITQATELLKFYSMECPADAKLWGRLKSASVAADELEVSVGIIRHVEITNPVAHLPTWPWST